MEQPRNQKYFTMLSLSSWIFGSQQLVYYILRGAQECSSGSRLRCIPSGRRYTMFPRETGCLKFSVSRTTTAVPHRQGRQNRRDSDARQLWTFCREPFTYHKNVLREPGRLLRCSPSISLAPASQAGFLAPCPLTRCPLHLLVPLSVCLLSSLHFPTMYLIPL